MDSLFASVLDISWQAGLIALAVMVVRPLLRRAPRRAVCMLWLLVALRLLLPVRLTVESPVSLQQPESPPLQVYQELRQQEKAYVSTPPEQRAETVGPAAAQGFALLDQLPAIWLTGVGCMALYMALSLLRMRWRLRAASRIQDNVYRCTDWSTPFVLGVFAPRIYVPETVSEQDFPQVLAHERCHIRRWDHVWKPLAFLLLAVNWFNPVLWAAYVLLGRDMERACDEMVLKNATPAQRAAYSRALVACAAQPKMAAVCPLAFGEVAVKERVKNVLNYKKPALWAVVLLVVAAAVIVACLLTRPAAEKTGIPEAEKLYALRTPYVGNPAAVGAILDALGFPTVGSIVENDTYTYSIRLDTNKEPLGVTVCYAFAGAVPERSAEWNRQMAQRGYIAMALIGNIDWFRWTDIDQADTAYVTGVVYSGDYVDELNAAKESAEDLQAYMDTLRAKVEDGSIVYYPGDAQPSFEETTPWSSMGENDPCSVKAEDYGIVYDPEHIPDWDTVPLSYLCAYYVNADGAYAEGAMDVLTKRYMRAPNSVEEYIKRLSGKGYGDAAEVLMNDINAYLRANYEELHDDEHSDADAAAELEVYTVTWETGDSAKQVVSLTEEQAQSILSEQGVVQPEWHQVCAELWQGDERLDDYMGTDYKPVPPTVLKILTEQCGYTFVTPEDFRGNMTAAKLEFYGGETYTAAKADLLALQKMLANAKAYGGASSCIFTAKLTVTFDDGRTVSVLKGTDSCASFMFGSWNTAMVSSSENERFWQIFGVPFEG